LEICKTREERKGVRERREREERGERERREREIVSLWVSHAAS